MAAKIVDFVTENYRNIENLEVITCNRRKNITAVGLVSLLCFRTTLLFFQITFDFFFSKMQKIPLLP